MFADQPVQHVSVNTLWEDTFGSIIGLESCKKVMFEYVCKPRVFPDHYVRTHMPCHFALIGPDGCGKRTLIETTCQMRHINYVYMTSWAPRLMQGVIAFARHHAPCVIHLDDEYGDAFEKAERGERTQFIDEYLHQVINSGMYTQWGMVWLAFSLRSETPLHSQMLLRTVQERVGRYDATDTAELVEYMRRHIRTNRGANLDALIGNSATNMESLAQAVATRTPAQIEEYFRRVWFHRTQRATPMELHNSGDVPLEPTWDDDFVPCMQTTDPRTDVYLCAAMLEIPQAYHPPFMDPYSGNVHMHQ